MTKNTDQGVLNKISMKITGQLDSLTKHNPYHSNNVPAGSGTIPISHAVSSGTASNSINIYSVGGGGGTGGGTVGYASTINTYQQPKTVFSDDLIIKRSGKPDIAVGATLEKIADRLAILEPDLDKMSRFPALKEAYDNYKLIEALVDGMDDDNKP